ncbi:MAG: prolyl oligopeptidase family serine peptidase [Planctomycetaceae bacterium]
MNITLLGLLILAAAPLDGDKDNDPNNVRQVPRPGVEVPASQRQTLEADLRKLSRAVMELSESKDPWVLSLLPDIEIFHRAVRCALTYDEFFANADIKRAQKLLQIGQERATQLANGSAPWTVRPGLQVFGYRSKIDNTVQPYGLVIPDTYRFIGREKHRCDIWFHGRGETLSEVNFINQRLLTTGQYTPDDTIVLHPYGRYSNAFKFAGEIDVLEALAEVKRRFRIDNDRVSVRGFSMGGAACWQFAVHYPDQWFAANPGAGFSETPEFLKSFQKETLNPTWYEEKLWQWYDCPGYAANLIHCPTIAYSGEVDVQKQAADIMEPALSAQGVAMTHIIGPKTGHKIHAESKLDIEQRMRSLADVGRNRFPNPLRFTTYTLRYNRMHWFEVRSLKEHWKKATVNAGWDGNELEITTTNISAFAIKFPAGRAPFQPGEIIVRINGQEIAGAAIGSDKSFHFEVHHTDDWWEKGPVSSRPLRKRHGLTGPIDDAFMDSFVFVSPSGQTKSKSLRTWQASELDHAIKHWRQQFRGDAVVREDTDVSRTNIADSNLVLWGDSQNNMLIKQIMPQLPIQWNATEIRVGERTYSSEHHALVMIYPNPLNQKKYVVLNSSFTYREYAYLNNARQVPMLPDWAVIDLRTPPGTQYPGKVVDAGFFDEQWQLKPNP